MTNEEVIKRLKDILEEVTETDNSVCYVTSDDMDTLKAAIKALEQQTSGDCVSRDTFKRAVSELTYWHPTTDGRLEVGGAFDNTVYKVEDVWRLTRELPSVTPQPKVGKWIDVDSLDGALWHDCSECGETEFYATDYCPNCGAKMEVEE